MKTKPLIFVLLSALFCWAVISIFFGNTEAQPAIMAVLFLAILVTILTACMVLTRWLRLGAQKSILLYGAVAFVVCGLYPPWLYTFDQAGMRSEKDAGYHSILAPPTPEENFRAYGVKLDGVRLLVEWGCILAVSGAAWGVARLNRKRLLVASQKPDGNGG